MNSDLSSTSMRKWEQLQSLIKYEITLMNLLKTQIESATQIFKNNCNEYYTKKILIKETYESNSKQIANLKKFESVIPSLPKIITEPKAILNNYYYMIENFLFKLRTDNTAMLSWITHLKPEKHEEIINLLLNFFYENPFNSSFSQDDLFDVICVLLKNEINNWKSPLVTSFLDSNFLSKLLKGLSRRPDIKNYWSMVWDDLILDMENMSNSFMSLETSRCADFLKSKMAGTWKENKIKYLTVLTENQEKQRSSHPFNTRDSKKADNYIESDATHMLYDGLTKSRLGMLLNNNSLSSSLRGSIINTPSAELKENDQLSSSSFWMNNLCSSNNQSRKDLKWGSLENEYIQYAIKKSSQLLLPPEIIDVDKYLLTDWFEHDDNYKNNYDEDELNYRAVSITTSKYMQEFYKKQWTRLKNEKNLSYDNTKFIKELAQYKEDWTKVWAEYKRNFEKFKFFIDKLLLNLLQNESIVPYSIKVICKLIDILIVKKFPNISIIDKNAFISEFWIGTLILPILTNPDYNGIITTSFISQATRVNMIYLNKIWKKLFRGAFFESQLEANYTWFNTYFCEVMPTVGEIFEKIQVVKLNNSLCKILGWDYNDEIKEDNKLSDMSAIFNGEKEHNWLQHKSICFTNTDFRIIYKTILKNENSFFNYTDPNTQQTPSPQFFQMFNLIKLNEKDIMKAFEKQWTESSSSKVYIIISKNNFTINELDESLSKEKRFSFASASLSSPGSAETTNENNFILNRVKYCIKTIWRKLNFINLNKNFFLEKSKSTPDFFNGLNKIIQFEDYSDRLCNDEIPWGWFGLYWRYNWNWWNEQYSDNDYELWYNEWLDEVNKSIYQLQNNSVSGQIEMKITCSEKMNELIEKDYRKTKSIEKFIRIYLLLNNVKLPVLWKVDSKTHKLKITKEKKKNANCQNIADFVLAFSRLRELEEDIISTSQPNNVNRILSEYISWLKNEIIIQPDLASWFKEFISSEDSWNDLMDDIENKIVEEMYSLIYPKEPSLEDQVFYQKCVEITNTTPESVGVKSMYINENLWSIAICYLNRMDTERSPLNKLNCVECAYKVLNNCISFCGGKNEGAGFDDIFPIFVYVIIKARPNRFYSNMNYSKSLMNPEKIMNKYGFAYMQIEMAINFIMNLQADKSGK